MATQEFIATGRRKEAVARIRMSPGTGKIEVNGKTFEEYFPTANLQGCCVEPDQTANCAYNQVIAMTTQSQCHAPSVWQTTLP